MQEKLLFVEEAVGLVKNNDKLLVGGFGLSGAPLTLLDALAERGTNELTVVSNNLGEPNKGLGKLLVNGQIKKAIGSFFTSHRGAVQAWSEGEIEIDLIPQGTMAEGLRAGGAGIPAFYTPTAAGTQLAEGKEVRNFEGRDYVLEYAIKGDVALIKAAKADRYGNLVYYKTAKNFNPAMAAAGKTVLVEVDEIVEPGEIRSEDVDTPHLYVDHLVLSRYVKEGGVYVEANDQRG